jgi:hypothetical protein
MPRGSSPRQRAKMKAPVVIVAVTLTGGILVVASFLIATGARGESAVRLACATAPAHAAAIAGGGNRSVSIQRCQGRSTDS